MTYHAISYIAGGEIVAVQTASAPIPSPAISAETIAAQGLTLDSYQIEGAYAEAADVRPLLRLEGGLTASDALTIIRG